MLEISFGELLPETSNFWNIWRFYID